MYKGETIMATKYGEAAFKALARMKTEFKTRRNTIFAIAAIIIIYLVLTEYVFK